MLPERVLLRCPFQKNVHHKLKILTPQGIKYAHIRFPLQRIAVSNKYLWVVDDRGDFLPIKLGCGLIFLSLHFIDINFPANFLYLNIMMLQIKVLRTYCSIDY